jgi:hypothetical protein
MTFIRPPLIAGRVATLIAIGICLQATAKRAARAEPALRGKIA